MLTQSLVSKLLILKKSSRVVLAISLFMLFGSAKLLVANGHHSAKEKSSLHSVIVFILLNENELMVLSEADRPIMVQSPCLRQTTPPFMASPRAFGPPYPKPVTESFDCRVNSPIFVR